MRMTFKKTLLAAGAVTAVAASCAFAQEEEPARAPNAPIFETALPNLPGQRITAWELTFEGDGAMSPHRHSGSVYVYVIEGAVRLGVEGEPARVFEAGESFFEPAGALHNVGANANPDGPSRVLAIAVGSEDAPTVVREPQE